MANTITFLAGLVRQEELKQSAAGNTYLRLSVAKNNGSFQNKETGEWQDRPSTYANLTLFGRQAELFAKSNIPKGTELLISANQSAELRPAYVNKDGIEVPERIEETYQVQSIGVSISKGRLVSVSLANSNNSQAAAPVQQTYSAAQPVQAVPQQPQAVAPAQPVSTNTDDLFSSQPITTAAPASFDEDDIFA